MRLPNVPGMSKVAKGRQVCEENVLPVIAETHSPGVRQQPTCQSPRAFYESVASVRWLRATFFFRGGLSRFSPGNYARSPLLFWPCNTVAMNPYFGANSNLGYLGQRNVGILCLPSRAKTEFSVSVTFVKVILFKRAVASRPLWRIESPIS